MRALVTFAILVTLLIALASPVEAGRGMHGGTTVRVVVGSHHNRVVVVPNHHFHNNVFRFNRFGFVQTTPGFFNGFDRFRFSRFAQAGQFAPFGFANGFGGFGLDYGYASPTVASAPPAVPQPPPAPPTRVAADLPPCHEETPSGVTIDRGMGCSRAPQ